MVCDQGCNWAGSPARIVLEPDQVQIWSVHLDQPRNTREDYWRLLTGEEQTRAQRFLRVEHQQHFVVGRGVLRSLLGLALQTDPAGLRFAYGKEGKPYLEEPFEIAFNLSHSHKLALCGLATRGALGVDVQHGRNLQDAEAIVARFFSESENRTFQRLPEARRREAFFKAWTRKESLMKATGTGFAEPLESFELVMDPDAEARVISHHGDIERARGWKLWDLRPLAGYMGALASRNHKTAPVCWHWS